MNNLLFLCEDDGQFNNYNRFHYFFASVKKNNVYDELVEVINNEHIDTLICDKAHIQLASKLLWTNNSVKRYILTDSDTPLLVEESNKKLETKMWDIIAVRSENDPIKQAGWISSFTNESFTQKEMQEWVKNAVNKLMPYLFQSANVLEIGIASGITCSEIAPYVKKYVGVDISKETLKRTEEILKMKGLTNVSLIVADAIDVGGLDIEKQDIIIVNSVAQYFAGYNYFIVMVKGLLKCMKDSGIIFLGDILDFDLKETFDRSLTQNGIRRRNVSDLYYPRKLMQELPVYIPEIIDVEITEKTGQIENELKKYRYDVMLHIDKHCKNLTVKRTKFQYAMHAKNFSIDIVEENEKESAIV